MSQFGRIRTDSDGVLHQRCTGDEMAKRRIAFTKKAVEAIEPPPKGRLYVYDERTPHLAVCVTAQGTKTFYRCGRVHGKASRIRIGTSNELSVEQARDICKQLTGEVASGGDPAERLAAKRAEPRLADLWTWYLEHHARPHKSTWEHDARRYDRYLKRWEHRRLSSLTRDEIAKYLGEISTTRGKYASNKVRELLRFMFTHAESVGYAGQNPCTKIKRQKVHSRERYLRPNEVRAFFDALESLRPVTRRFILLALYTGARRSNVASMRWDELDLTHGIWTISAEKFKNRKATAIVLPPAALELLKEIEAERDDSPWVLPGWGKTGHIVEPKHAMETIRKLAKIEDLRMHDLRRTLGSWQAALGTPLHTIGKSLGHASIASTEVYARLDLSTVRESVSRAVDALIAASKVPAKDS